MIFESFGKKIQAMIYITFYEILGTFNFIINITQMKASQNHQKHSELHSIEPPDDRTFQTLSRTKDQISEHYQQYSDQMKKFDGLKKQKLIQKLADNGILQSGDKHYNITKVVISQQKNSFLILVIIGNLSMYISFLKTHVNIDFINTNQIGEGAYGKISLLEFENKKYVAKSQQFISSERLFSDKKFDSLLEEYFFAKIASCLGVGPHLQSLFGYDILIHGNSFEFVMQYCQNISSSQEKIRKDLMKNLKIMHEFGIVHLDIKPENISWSNQFKKWVFLDFGFSRLLKNKVGYKTLAGFIGTYNYVCPELKKLYHTKSKDFVDLYYNDYYCVQRTLESFQVKTNGKQKMYPSFYSEQNKKKSFLEQVVFILKMKFCLQNNDYQNLSYFACRINQLKQLVPVIILKEMEQKSEQVKKILHNLFIKQKERLSILCPQDDDNQYIKKELLKLFEEEEILLKQWIPFSKFLDEETKLRKLLKVNWGNKDFMKEMFQFFHKILFNKDQFLRQKNKILRNLIIQQIFPAVKKKSFFGKTIYILENFQEFFHQEEDIKAIIQILYQIFDDKRKIFSIQMKRKDIEIQNNIYDFFDHIIGNSGIEKSKISLRNIQQIEFKGKNKIFQKQKNIVVKILKKILQIIEKKSFLEHTQLANILEQYFKFPFQSRTYYFLLNEKLQKWIKNLEVLNGKNYFQFPMKQAEKSQELKILKIIEGIQSCLNLGLLNQMCRMIESNPFVSEIPSLWNLKYLQITKQKNQKKEMAQDILDKLKVQIQFGLDICIQIIKVLEISTNEYAYFLLDSFLQYSLPRLQKNFLPFYVQLIQILLSIREKYDSQKQQKTTLDRKIGSLLQRLVHYFQNQELELKSFIEVQQFKIFAKYIKGEDAITSFILLFQKSFEQRKQWMNATQLNILDILCSFQGSCSNKQKLSLKRLILQHNDSLTEGEKHWTYINSSSFLIKLVQVSLREDEGLKKIYSIIKEHTDYISQLKRMNLNLGRVVVYFFSGQYSTLKNPLQLAQNILESETIGHLGKNCYLSGLIFMIYLPLKSLLSNEQKKRLLILSMSAISSFPFLQIRYFMLNSFVSEYKFVKKCNSLRKKMIHSKRLGYSRCNTVKWKQKVIQKLNGRKSKISLQKCLQKIQFLQENLSQQFQVMDLE